MDSETQKHINAIHTMLKDMTKDINTIKDALSQNNMRINKLQERMTRNERLTADIGTGMIE